jgi:hypothetical protein
LFGGNWLRAVAGEIIGVPTAPNTPFTSLEDFLAAFADYENADYKNLDDPDFYETGNHTPDDKKNYFDRRMKLVPEAEAVYEVRTRTFNLPLSAAIDISQLQQYTLDAAHYSYPFPGLFDGEQAFAKNILPVYTDYGDNSATALDNYLPAALPAADFVAAMTNLKEVGDKYHLDIAPTDVTGKEFLQPYDKARLVANGSRVNDADNLWKGSKWRLPNVSLPTGLLTFNEMGMVAAHIYQVDEPPTPIPPILYSSIPYALPMFTGDALKIEKTKTNGDKINVPARIALDAGTPKWLLAAAVGWRVFNSPYSTATADGIYSVDAMPYSVFDQANSTVTVVPPEVNKVFYLDAANANSDLLAFTDPTEINRSFEVNVKNRIGYIITDKDGKISPYRESANNHHDRRNLAAYPGTGTYYDGNNFHNNLRVHNELAAIIDVINDRRGEPFADIITAIYDDPRVGYDATICAVAHGFDAKGNPKPCSDDVESEVAAGNGHFPALPLLHKKFRVRTAPKMHDGSGADEVIEFAKWSDGVLSPASGSDSINNNNLDGLVCTVPAPPGGDGGAGFNLPIWQKDVYKNSSNNLKFTAPGVSPGSGWDIHARAGDMFVPVDAVSGALNWTPDNQSTYLADPESRTKLIFMNINKAGNPDGSSDVGLGGLDKYTSIATIPYALMYENKTAMDNNDKRIDFKYTHNGVYFDDNLTVKMLPAPGSGGMLSDYLTNPTVDYDIDASNYEAVFNDNKYSLVPGSPAATGRGGAALAFVKGVPAGPGYWQSGGTHDEIYITPWDNNNIKLTGVQGTWRSISSDPNFQWVRRGAAYFQDPDSGNEYKSASWSYYATASYNAGVPQNVPIREVWDFCDDPCPDKPGTGVLALWGIVVPPPTIELNPQAVKNAAIERVVLNLFGAVVKDAGDNNVVKTANLTALGWSATTEDGIRDTENPIFARGDSSYYRVLVATALIHRGKYEVVGKKFLQFVYRKNKDGSGAVVDNHLLDPE